MPLLEKEIPLGLDGKRLSEEEILRLKILLKPVINDMLASEKNFTEVERKNQDAFEASLQDRTEEGKAARDAFDRSC